MDMPKWIEHNETKIHREISSNNTATF
jgi:hypothetical protein